MVENDTLCFSGLIESGVRGALGVGTGCDRPTFIHGCLQRLEELVIGLVAGPNVTAALTGQ